MLQSVQEKKVSKNKIFNKEQLADLDFKRIPKHVAIIMDGNRRWALQNNLPYQLAYVTGAERLKKIVEAAIELGIEVLTVYAFSTENWKRPQEEVKVLLSLLKEYILNERDSMAMLGIRLKVIGDTSVFNSELKEAIFKTEETTKEGRSIDLVLALNYGGRDDISRALTRITQDCLDKKIKPSQVSESLISKYLDTAEYTDPDLLIRTSGEFRISNFLIWQLAYTEIIVQGVFWPDFNSNHLLSAVKNYINREKRCGV